MAGRSVCTNAKCPGISSPARKVPSQAARQRVTRYAVVPLATSTPGNDYAHHDKRRKKRNRRSVQGHVPWQKRPHALEGSMKRTYIARCQQVHSVDTSTK